MLPKPNYRWKCKICGKEILSYKDKENIILNTAPRKCPRCGEEMEECLIIKGGPFPNNPFRKD